MSTEDTQREPPECCPHCGCPDLFVRKDFPQRLGLALVAGAALAFLVLAAIPQTFYIGVWVLVGVTLIDAMLYLLVPKVATCYRCRADLRGYPLNPRLEGFELSIAEKYRGQP